MLALNYRASIPQRSLPVKLFFKKSLDSDRQLCYMSVHDEKISELLCKLRSRGGDDCLRRDGLSVLRLAAQRQRCRLVPILARAADRRRPRLRPLHGKNRLSFLRKPLPKNAAHESAPSPTLLSDNHSGQFCRNCGGRPCIPLHPRIRRAPDRHSRDNGRKAHAPSTYVSGKAKRYPA